MLPSQLDVANKLISSPDYITRYKKEEEVSQHQLHFFAEESPGKEDLQNELIAFGEKLKQRVLHSPFHWNGFGILHCTSEEIEFEPDRIRTEAMQPVSAQKVLRENARYNMLVGDQEMSSHQVVVASNQVAHKRSWVLIAGWILLGLTVIAILIYLYMKNFQTASTGLQTSW